MDVFLQEISLTPRGDSKKYHIQPNDGVLDILSLVYEFKVANGQQLARFLEQREDAKYLYLKLRRMWRAGLFESFKVFGRARFGAAVYYLLTPSGLEMIRLAGRYSEEQIASYPNYKSLIARGNFEHDASVVEIASIEARNSSNRLRILFTGEAASSSAALLSGKNIELFTPDYTATYSFGADTKTVYTEYERTQKSKDLMIKKLQRYIRHLGFEERQGVLVRFIFQTPAMERLFWNIVADNHAMLSKLRIVTTHLPLLAEHKQFLEPVYAYSANTENRIKLIPFL